MNRRSSIFPLAVIDVSREFGIAYKASSSKIVPVMVLMHGSAGVGPALSQWVDAFNEIGVATFVVDSFGPRGVKSMVENQTLIPTAANLMDAFQALQVLATHPRIDPTRIGVMGISKGGEVAFRSAIRRQSLYR
jgi:dienelactone hydrolase